TTEVMPAAFARSATSLPTLAAASWFAVPPVRSSASSVLAETSVEPAMSSITCATTCRFDRYTERRGRSGVPITVRRTRAWRRLRPSCFFFVLSLISIASLAGLASLAADVLVDVADALALVRLGLSPRTDVGGHLADELLVDAVDLDAGRLAHR